LVEGCRRYLERGLDDPPEVLEATARYRAEVDDLWRFLQERTVREEGATVQACVPYDAYKAWAREEGIEPASQKRFADVLGNLGFEKVTIAGRRHYRGLRLVDGPPGGDGGGGEGGEGGEGCGHNLGPHAAGPENFSLQPSPCLPSPLGEDPVQAAPGASAAKGGEEGAPAVPAWVRQAFEEEGVPLTPLPPRTKVSEEAVCLSDLLPRRLAPFPLVVYPLPLPIHLSHMSLNEHSAACAGFRRFVTKVPSSS